MCQQDAPNLNLNRKKSETLSLKGEQQKNMAVWNFEMV